MSTIETPGCGVCDHPAVPVPRLRIRQERHYDCPQFHEVGLCAEHGAALQGGAIALHQLLFDWTHRHHAELYDGTRLVLSAEPMCLGCNAALSPADGQATARCASCGKENVLGSALGSPAIVRLA